MDYQIKAVTRADVSSLQQISRETFRATFNKFTAPADMDRFLKEDYETKKLLNEIANPNSRFFFLIVAGQIAGYLKINVGSAQTEQLKENALEVERIYLREAFQHQGFGNILLDYAEEIARREHKDYLWLGVYEHNTNAQRFYKRHGFKRVSEHVFQVGDDSQVDYLLVKKLD